jgi:hypothetical protein
MFVSGYTFIRNAVKFDYPVLESILSVLPLVDEMIVLVGNSDDATLKLIGEISSSKIKIHHSVWNDNLREGGRVLADETQKAINLISPNADWIIGLQADECLHENDYPLIQKAMESNLGDQEVDGLLFSYLHFYGDYGFVANGRKWYRNEIRIIRNSSGIFPYRDAQGFRKTENKKLKVRQSGATIYHYGWVKPPEKQTAKLKFFHSLWHPDNWVQKTMGQALEYDYSNIDSLKVFDGSHPAVYANRIANYQQPPGLRAGLFIRQPIKRLLFWFEKLSGWRIGEYKNYTLLR